MKYLDYLLSFISGKLVDIIESPVNGELYVYYVNGKYILNSATANYSFGKQYIIFRRLFRRLEIKSRKINKVLLLGLGGGSVISLLAEEFKLNCLITAIEIDPVIIEIAQKYFNIGRFENLKIHVSDAFDFMKENVEQYDLIVCDIYIDIDVPSIFETAEFLELLKNSLQPDGLLVFNKDLYSEKMKLSVYSFENNFWEVFQIYTKYQLIPDHYFFVNAPKIV